MKKLYRGLVLMILAVFLFTGTALASDELIFHGGSVYDDGYMHLLFSTSYSDKADMNFEALSDSGPIWVENAFVLRDKGTSWFVVLDYGRKDSTGDTNHVTITQDALLKGLSGLVADSDEGALVTVGSAPEINMTSASTFRANLEKTPGTSDRKYLASTLGSVLNYINANSNKLMPKISIVVITSARYMEEGTPAEIERLLNTNGNNMYTTHIICTAGSEKSYGAAKGGWRDKAKQLAEKGLKTAGGTSFVTDILNEEEAQKAVDRVRDAERKLIRVELDPVKNGAISKNITVSQTTSGGKRFDINIELSDENLTLIETAIKGKVPPVEHNYTPTGSNTFFIDNSVEEPAQAAGMGIELIIGIVLGVVIIALVIVLIILRSRKKGGQKVEAAYVAAPANNASKTVVTLSGANGVVLKGAMSGGRLTIGRDPSRAKLVVANDKKVSGLHMTLTLQGSAMTLTDNNSTNGVKVNGAPVTGSCQVRQNDTIGLGSTSYTISWHRM